MSLTSYRAAPPRAEVFDVWTDVFDLVERKCLFLVSGSVPPQLQRRRMVSDFRRPGGDLLSHALRRSTIGAEGFHGRVRDGIGCRTLAMTTRPAKNRFNIYADC